MHYSYAYLVGTAGTQDLSWFQIGVLKQYALRALGKAPEGGFVIRSSQSNPQHYVLSYKNNGEIRHQLIRITTGDDSSNDCFYLDTRRELLFRSIQDLAIYFSIYHVDDHVRLVFPENWRLQSTSGCKSHMHTCMHAYTHINATS